MSAALSSIAETGAPPAIEPWLESLRGTYPDDDIADFRAAHAYYLMSYSLVAFSGLTTSHGSEHNFRPPFTVCLYGMNRV